MGLFHNSASLAQLLTRYAVTASKSALQFLTSTLPVASRPVLLGNHYTFRGGDFIDLDALIGGLNLR